MSSAVLHIARRWPRPVTVIEADPDGGRLACRHGLRPGLTDLAHALRFGRPVGTQDHVSAVSLVPAPPDPEETIGAIDGITSVVGSLETSLGTDVLFNVGILRPSSPADGITRAADARILMMRCTLDDVAAVLHRHRTLETLGRWSILTAGGSLTTIQISRVIKWPVLAELIPLDGHNMSILARRISEFLTFIGSEAGQ